MDKKRSFVYALVGGIVIGVICVSVSRMY